MSSHSTLNGLKAKIFLRHNNNEEEGRKGIAAVANSLDLSSAQVCVCVCVYNPVIQGRIISFSFCHLHTCRGHGGHSLAMPTKLWDMTG